MPGIKILEFILIAVVLILIGIPLFKKFPPRRLFAPLDTETEDYKHMLVRKEEILLAIKEAEMDFKIDKVSQEDYDIVRHKLENEVLKVMGRIDELEKVLKNKKPASRSVDIA